MNEAWWGPRFRPAAISVAALAVTLIGLILGA